LQNTLVGEFFLDAPLGLIILSFIRFFVKEEWRVAQKAKTDYLGIILHSTALFALIYIALGKSLLG